MELETVRLTVADYIATVEMDRPPVNAQNAQARNELTWVFDTISDRDDVRVAILTGTGNMFSAGADIKERPGLVKEPGDYLRHNRITRECYEQNVTLALSKTEDTREAQMAFIEKRPPVFKGS